MADLKKGDHVTWNAGSEGKHIAGTVQKTITTPMEIKGHHVAASPENPEVVVKSDTTGALAAHKPESLHEGTSTSKRGA